MIWPIPGDVDPLQHLAVQVGDKQGQGLATEAARAMSQWLAAAGVTERRAHIHPKHVASERVAQAMGMADSGRVDEDGERIWVVN